MKAMWGGLLLMIFFSMGVSSAQAADGVGLSRDGVTWHAGLAGGLFDSTMRWVPGDSETETFYVRNQGPSSALLKIEARSADTDRLLSDDVIALRARVDTGTWVELQNGAPTESLTTQSINHHDVVQVDVNATFDPAASNQSQRKDLALTFTVILAESVVDRGDGAGPDHGGSGGLLPATGAQVSVWLIVVAGVMLVVGSQLVRRREEVRHG